MIAIYESTIQQTRKQDYRVDRETELTASVIPLCSDGAMIRQ